MAPSSSGGSTVGESLNILERYDLGGVPVTTALHDYLEASALAYADRGAYLGDPAYVDVPLKTLLDDTFAAERACGISQTAAAKKPVAAGALTGYDGVCPTVKGEPQVDPDTENVSTTNLTVADKWGNVVEYTLTIEQTGGSGIVVPDRGFLLNNELTDFSTVYSATDPNRIQPGKRPRSSMSPTIVLKNGKPFLALGTPGGSTIITTVLQMIVNRIDLGMTVEEAMAAPRASQRKRHSVTGGAGVHRRLRHGAHRPGPHARPRGRRPDQRPVHRRGHRDRVRQEGLPHRRRRARPPRWRRHRRGEQDQVGSLPVPGRPGDVPARRGGLPPLRSSLAPGGQTRPRPPRRARPPPLRLRQRAAATLSSVPASFWAK